MWNNIITVKIGWNKKFKIKKCEKGTRVQLTTHHSCVTTVINIYRFVTRSVNLCIKYIWNKKEEYYIVVYAERFSCRTPNEEMF